MRSAEGPAVRLRPKPRVRLVERDGRVLAYPQPCDTPVLPRGWAPLTREQQTAALRACDDCCDAILFRIGSVWEPGCEYRVYRLDSDSWAGVAVVCTWARTHSGQNAGGVRQLLGLALDPREAVDIAVRFLNWDLEAHGQSWRLEVNGAGSQAIAG